MTARCRSGRWAGQPCGQAGVPAAAGGGASPHGAHQRYPRLLQRRCQAHFRCEASPATDLLLGNELVSQMTANLSSRRSGRASSNQTWATGMRLMHCHCACAGRSLPLGVAYMARKLGHDLEEEDAAGAARRAAATAAAAAALEQTGDSCGGDSAPPPPPRGAQERPISTARQRGGPHRWATCSLLASDWRLVHSTCYGFDCEAVADNQCC